MNRPARTPHTLAFLAASAVSLAASGAAAAPPVAAATQAPVTVPFDPKTTQVQAQAQAAARLPVATPPPGHRLVEDRTGRKQVGKASVYAGHFQGRRMADGNRFRHSGISAASRTLPLGTVAKVTNQETGQTALVTIQDHGPYVDGRTVDLTRATANQIGITRRGGVAPVVVAPVAVPQRDGTVKPGAGAIPGPA